MKTLLLLLSVLFFICCGPKEKTTPEATIIIVLQPLADFPKAYTLEVEKNLRKIYTPVKVSKNLPFPEGSWNHNKSRRRADALIAYLTNLAGNNELIIGLTNKDISTTKNGINDWGVFGLGYCPGQSCIASTYRLKGNTTEKLFKVAIHELGHTQGLRHCPRKNCFMRDAKGKDVLQEETEFCQPCQLVLQNHHWNVK